MHERRQKLLRFAERASWAIGVAGAIWVGAYEIEVATSARQNLDRFAALRPPPLADPDRSLWSAIRISAWHDAMREPAATPLAVLRIPKIRLEVAVLPGTDDRTLDRAIGHIEDTAPPGTDGNSGLAGHRDGFFRGLKDIETGDTIVLETPDATEMYLVERTWIVTPEDVSVLDPTPSRSLTLVTCYPFYYVGSAPQRFIVRAVRVDDPVAPDLVRDPEEQ